MLVFAPFINCIKLSFDMHKKENTDRTHALLKGRGPFTGRMAAVLAALLASAALSAPAVADVPSLKGKRIGISVAGTEHYWDLKAYRGQIDEVKRLGGIPIALDGDRKDSQQIAQLQMLIAQKPDAIIEQLGTVSVLEP